MSKYLKVFLFAGIVASMILLVESFVIVEPHDSVMIEESLNFSKHIIYDEFISEGVAVADVNKDGSKDIISGHFWFEAPDWKKHEIREPESFDYTKGYSHSFLNFTVDVNKDGWLDYVCFDFPGEGVYWYENPKGLEGHWKENVIDTMACNESPMMMDMDGDGQPELVYSNEVSKVYKMATLKDGAWEVRTISEPEVPGTPRYSHGLGAGDINQDGHLDIMIREGWFESPGNNIDLWQFHPVSLGEPCSQMYAYDFDNDGDNDVLSASAHSFGIWWHEQTNINGRLGFTRHLIDSTFSQTHGVAFTDMDDDGDPDFITGKRFFAHQGKDPGGTEPAVLYWFEYSRDENDKPVWTKHLIDDDSGAGLQVVIEDMNGDGKLDIINGNKKGVIVFMQK